MISNYNKLTTKELDALTEVTKDIHTKGLKDMFQNPFPIKEEWVYHKLESNKEKKDQVSHETEKNKK